MPLLEEIENMPTTKYASGKELYNHAQKIAKKYDLYSHALLQTEMSSATWDEATELWRIQTNRNDDILTKWFIPASGPFHTPKFPEIPGIELFHGKSFHSSRWDYDYTGGCVDNPQLTKLRDKRVGVIGTGATAVQIVPAISTWVKDLYVFQRTPSAVNARNQKATDYEWVKKLSPGWQRERMMNFTTVVSGGDVQEDLINDGWTEAIRSTPGFFGIGGDGFDSETLAKRQQLADFKKMESVRRHIDEVVKDKATAEALKPYYEQFCKRPCFHDGYLSAFNQDNVHLVDTQGKGVERVSETCVYAGGKDWPLDCIIYATGFEFGGDFTKDNAPIIGPKGVSLSEKWKDGPTTFHSWGVNGFPNLLLMSVAQSAPNPNWTHTMVEMGDHLIYIVKECEKRGLQRVEPSAEAERFWVADAVKKSETRAEFLKNCTPGYYNNEGEVNEKTLRAQPYNGGALMFQSITKKWREDGKLEGLVWKGMNGN
ncbi:flavin-binding monooxygenase-like family [Pyrenophora seminiperda CCB06]|uniref:Flavin-binding monooxygenase-like family n=1 Tax=Pyrenophora seminiperda CCB06 TaxID=1302712 RepID=A0A3M7M1J0_9PLEO|nr:flavin-binding monooxygenase-like family [Pyrenophora seminiperda CCB06]